MSLHTSGDKLSQMYFADFKRAYIYTYKYVTIINEKMGH